MAALIVQGPILSSGMSGSGKWVEGYNCSDNILNVLDTYGHLFDDVVISTWNGEGDYVSDALAKSGVRFVFGNDPGRPNLVSGEIQDNRVRQWASVSNGLDALEHRDGTVIKLRSDQSLNLECFLESHRACRQVIQDTEDGGQQGIGTLTALYFWLLRPYALPDFAFAADFGTLRAFTDAQIRFARFRFTPWHGWPESDSVRKDLYAISDSERPLPCHFPNLPKDLRVLEPHRRLQQPPQNLVESWQHALRFRYGIAQKEVLKSLVWRGVGGWDGPDFHYHPQWLMARANFAAAASECLGVSLFSPHKSSGLSMTFVWTLRDRLIELRSEKSGLLPRTLRSIRRKYFIVAASFKRNASFKRSL